MKRLVKYIALVVLMLANTAAWAQTEEQTIKNDYMKDVAPEVVYIFMAVIVLMLLVTIALWSAVNTVKNKMFGTDEDALLEEGKITVEEAEKIKFTKRGFWERFFKAKPVVTDKDVLLDHDYDGIRELDNPAPPWFMFLFYGTITFAVAYMLIYHVFMAAPLQDEEYEIQMAEAQVQIDEYLKLAADRVDENSVTLLTDEAAILAGRKVYEKNGCNVCHGEEAQSGPTMAGPNLTDAYWIHGGDIQSVFKTIKYGVVEKGMRAWGEVLSPSEMQNVAAYIFSQQGKELEGGKEPEGELHNPVEEDVADSTQTDTVENIELSMLN